MSTSKTCSGPSSRSSSIPHSCQSEAKLVVMFNMHGKPIGENKKKMNKRALALAKVTFSVTYDNWNEIPNLKKRRPLAIAFAKERTVGTEEEGLDPNRVNLFLYARKIRKTGEFHPSVADYVGKISEMRSVQDESTRADIDSDALTQVLGKYKRGNTRGVGTKVSRTKIKAIRPLVSELQQVKNDVQQQKDVIERQMSLIEKQSERLGKLESTFSSKMDFLINLIQGQSQKQAHFPSSSSNQMYSTQIRPPMSNPTLYGCIPSHKGYYHIRDVEDKKNIAMGEIVDVSPGTIVHCRAMVALEAKVSVLGVYPGMENEKVYLGKQGGADTILDFVGISLVWPLNLLEKII